jgi:hypothetical protein
MGTNLKSTIDSLAQTFAAGILQAIRSAPLDEILGEGAGGRGGRKPGRPAKAASESPASTGGGKRARGGRLARRTADDIQAVVESIVQLVKKSKGGLRAEQIRAQLNLDKREIGRPIAEALAKKKLTKKGEKRATTYFAK